MTVAFTLEGRPVRAGPAERILDVARREGFEIPHLCALDRLGYARAGNCRSCVVEVEGERVLAASCIRVPVEGMSVRVSSDRALAARRGVLEMLTTDRPAAPLTRNDELRRAVAREGLPPSRLPPTASGHRTDRSHPAMWVDLDACILCTLCVRACRDVQVNDVIGIAGRGHEARIVFDMDAPMGSSTCVSCGECVQACPTGALSLANGASLVEPDREVPSVCAYCGVGCQVSYAVKDDRIVASSGHDGPANAGRLCVKGRFGFDYIRHGDRLTVPLIRKDGVPKRAEERIDPREPWTHFREASWDEALDRAAAGLGGIRDGRGGDALAAFGSAKGSNEEAYLVQKLVRTGFRSNNVDHCTRLCHASSVAALFEGLASAAVSNPFSHAAAADVIVVIGANPTVNHPVAATFIKNAAKAGAKLVVVDPRGQALARYATHMLRIRPGTDVALLNGLMAAIVDEGLQDDAFIRERTTGWEELRAHLARFPVEAMAAVCGIASATLRDVARLYASAPAAIIFWGMGISQHVHGTDNARCLIALALMTGQIGRPGTGLHPLRGQNNVQGASDAGLVPMFFPGYQPVERDDARSRLEGLWGADLRAERGLTVMEIMDAAYDGRIRGMYIVGENPAMSDPDLHHAREALARLDHLVVQDLFLTETAFHADVVLPGSAAPEKLGTYTSTDRRVQLGRPAVPLPGDARQDWWIIHEIGRRMGLPWTYSGPAEIYEEMRWSMLPPVLAGAPWERLEREGAVTYPVERSDSPGEEILFQKGFPTSDGRGRFVRSDIVPPDERPDEEFPMILTTGRLLEHWHTGAMTRRSAVLDALQPEAVVFVAPRDLERIAVAAGGRVRLRTRRGEIELTARADDNLPEGVVFSPFCFSEAAVNFLTNPALDPFGKIPELKYCAVRLEAAKVEPVESLAIQP